MDKVSLTLPHTILFIPLKYNMDVDPSHTIFYD